MPKDLAPAVLVAAMALGSAACGSSPALRAAQRGDLASLKTDVASRERAGTLGNGEAGRLARAVASWDVAHAPKEQAAARVRELRACAPEVDDALEARMKTRDAAGAEAALALVEAGRLGASGAREHAGDADDAWRAVGARGLVRDDDQPARSRALVDPAPAVRRAAMHAAIEAGDPRDLPVLADAARVDPEPIVRSEAVRALGAIGGPTAFAKLRDLWSSGDEALREDIASAYASPRMWGAGGRDALRVLLASGRGPGALEGAGAVLRGGARDAELDASATALLARTIAPNGESPEGSRRDRLHAIAVAPSPAASPALLAALRAAKDDADVAVRTGVLARLTESAPDRAASIASLESIAADRDRVAYASRARLALAGAGDLRIQAWLEADLASPDSSARLAAATALASLGRSGRAAPLLADPDPSVRARAACTLMLAARK